MNKKTVLIVTAFTAAAAIASGLPDNIYTYFTANQGDNDKLQPQKLIDENGRNVTTSSAVTYEWYRVDNLDSEFSNKIGTDKTYKLTDSDLDKYIGLRVTCDGKSFETVSITASLCLSL